MIESKKERHKFDQNFGQQSDIEKYQLINPKKKIRQNMKKLKKIDFKHSFWTNHDQNTLIELHKLFGNKWTSISKHFPKCCQNFIKNRFYSKLRKSIRKLNNCIFLLFGKKYPQFNLNVIFKLSNLAQGKIIGKCYVETQISTFYKELIYILIKFSQIQEPFADIGVNFTEQVENFVLAFIALENLFRIVSGERSYKGRKKNIAYLKKFSFKLDTQSSKVMVISKKNCFISSNSIDLQGQVHKSLKEISSSDQSSKPSLDEIKLAKVMTDQSHSPVFESFNRNILDNPQLDFSDSFWIEKSKILDQQDQELQQYEIGVELDKQDLLDQCCEAKCNFNFN